MPKLDLSKAPVKTGSIYPEPYASQMAGRSSIRLGELAGLTQYGVNIVMLEPGAAASLRHWHLNEDEFAMVLEGDLTLVEDDDETVMHPGDCAAWKAGVANGHRFVNRSDKPARFLVVGTKAPSEVATYSDVDMTVHIHSGKARFTYHDGSEWAGHRDPAPKGEKK
ncbi:MAG: cupin domain-containing protein [Paracoccaceae bacterium]